MTLHRTVLSLTTRRTGDHPSSAIATVIVIVLVVLMRLPMVFDPRRALGLDARDLTIDVRTQHTLSLLMCFFTDRAHSESQRYTYCVR